ncbi:MAG: DEAD/DEAH box helicase [Archangiaceae bacterium]|nr:DEAD/DEAH box helicase [Archangiaceae bacterium]
MSGPFTTRAAALDWLRAHDLEHLLQVSAKVLAPDLEKFRLLDLASDEGIARQSYVPKQLAALGLPQRAWAFFQSEHGALLEAKHDVERRLAPPAEPKAAELHRRLTVLRQQFSARVPAYPDRLLDPSRLELDPALPGFALKDARRWEVPGHFGFIDPVSRVRLDPAETQCSCQVPRCLHALAALDTVLLWLHQSGHEHELDLLGRSKWGRAIDALAQVWDAPQEDTELTWRVEVDGLDLQVTPYLGGRARPANKLAALLGHPLPAADAALAAHCENRDVAATLGALVGHPKVVLEKNPNRSVSVARTRVGLVAEDRGGSVLLTLGVDGTALPEPLLERIRKGQHERPLFLWDEGTCRLEQLDLEPRVRDAFAVLTRFGNVFPPEGVPPLLEQLATIASRVPVAMPRSVMGESAPAETALVLRLELLAGTERVRLELRVRPIAESAAFFPALGPRDVHVRRGLKPIHVVRAFKAETQAAEGLADALPLTRAEAIDPFVWELESAAEALEVVQVAARLPSAPKLEWVGEPVRVAGTGTPRQLRVKVEKRKRDWFGALGELSIHGERVKLAVALDAARRHRRFVRVTEHSYLELSDLLRAQLEQLSVHLQPGPRGVSLAATAADTLNNLRHAGAHIEVDDELEALISRLEAARALELSVPRALHATLRDYQREDFEWLARLSAWGAGAVLADDMGLGKTVQALALLLHRASLGPALVVAPTSVVFNWVQEAKRFAGSLKVHVRKPKRKLRAGDVLVTPYGLLPAEPQRWATLVLDEAHAIKNAATQRAKGVRELEADFVVALTGTPIENHLGELWSLFRVVMPSLLGSWDAFRDRFAIPIEKQLDPDAPRRLSRLVEPFLLRRTKAQVAAELPRRTDVRVPVTLSSAEWQLYEDARLAALSDLETGTRELKEQERRLEVLAALTRLRLLASHPRLYDPASTLESAKLFRLLELVQTLRDEGHRALVFSQFTSHLGLVREALDAQGISYQYLDGETAATRREQVVRAFQEGSDPLFLLSLKAGGVGLNLTGADNVILLDPWWNPAVEDQATDRTHRIGQTKPVTVYRLVASGTIEEKILALHEKKRALVAGVLDGKEAAAKLSPADLLALLQPGASS